MKKESVPAAFFSVKTSTKPVIDFIKTKLEIMKRLDENNRLRNADEAFQSQFPRIGGNIKTTAEKLLQLYIKKSKNGGLNGLKLSFTYSYFIQHLDGRTKKTALKEHLLRLVDSYKGILSKKYRDTLALPSRIINCITIEFAPGVIQYTEPRYNALHDMPLTIKPIRPILSLNSAYTQNQQVIHKSEERIGKFQKISDVLPSFLKPT